MESFISIGAFSSEKNYLDGDATRAVKWIAMEVDAFGELLSTWGDYCAWMGARSAALLLEKAGCEHAKGMIHPDHKVSLDLIKLPSSKASDFGWKFFTDIWNAGEK